jgi:hypothetical protein
MYLRKAGAANAMTARAFFSGRSSRNQERAHVAYGSSWRRRFRCLPRGRLRRRYRGFGGFVLCRSAGAVITVETLVSATTKL